MRENSDLIKNAEKNSNDQVNYLLREGDIVVLDRGFRDVITVCEDKFKLQTKMPHFLDKKKKQFTTTQANESRLCTKIRWVVEATNSLLKQKHRALDKTVQNKELPHLLIDFRIAGALINRFCVRLTSDKGNEEKIAKNMLVNLKRVNELQNIVQTYGLHRKSQFKDADLAELQCFPKVSLENLKINFAYGSFQLKYSPSYLTEFFKNHGSIRLCCNEEILKLISKILTASIHSRHSNSKSYRTYLQYLPQPHESNNENVVAILDWFCECKSGTRTLGGCCHVTAIVYYLAYGRFQQKLKQPAEYLNAIFKQSDQILNESSTMIESEDESQSEPQPSVEKTTKRTKKSVYSLNILNRLIINLKIKSNFNLL